ncbi:MAG: glutamine amidotransferase [Armatimonadetes bacterium]|nr:glutamine amidotransferase [Armatimonadota bacterium]
MDLRVCHLYPDLLNLYGDRGNVLVLERRCRDRGIDVSVTRARVGDALDARTQDLIFLGGGEDRQQGVAVVDLRRRAADLGAAAASGTVILAVCGSYQLLGHVYHPAEGPALEGVHLLDLETRHPGRGARRLIGNIAIECSLPGVGALVGFENHGGVTDLGAGATPLGRVRVGYGNNGEDKTEGAMQGTIFGTYLHGPLLPKNPSFADALIGLALRRRFGEVRLAPLDDDVESAARRAALARIGASYPTDRWRGRGAASS